jgi:peroxiredoxin
MDIILLLVRIVLFGIFFLAALGKFFDLTGAEKAMKEFGVPERFAGPFAAALALAEATVALLFLFVTTSWFGAIGGLALLFGFIVGMIWQMAKGKTPDCHCFGQVHSEPIGKKSLIRNSLFAVLASFLVFQGANGQGVELGNRTSDTILLVVLLMVAVVAIIIAVYVKKIFDRQSQILRRLEIIELFAHEGTPQERNDAGDPTDGIPIGSPFPDFELPNTDGRVVTLDHILGRSKPVLLFFVSPTCDPCAAMLPDIENWRAALEHKVSVVMLSSGTAQANNEKFRPEFSGEILLQAKREIADLVRARWTPTALLLRSDGTIASHLAAGDTAIRELVEKVEAENLKEELFYVTNGNGNGLKPRIGESAPAFKLKTIDGTDISSDLLKGRKTMLVFWSLTCPHCQAMMGELESWEKSRSDSEPSLLVFSDGDPDEFASVGLRAPIVLDKGYKTAAKFGMSGTPSAVLVDDNGTIITETAIGASNIWALIGRRN